MKTMFIATKNLQCVFMSNALIDSHTLSPAIHNGFKSNFEECIVPFREKIINLTPQVLF